MSGVNWKIEKDLCRCCHAEGSFINLGMPCEDHAETYSDMLKNCLDINVIPVEGVLCELTYTICEACVLRLRDASNFKRQVLMLEERFKEMYSNNFIKAFSGVKEELPDTYPDAFKEEEDYSPHMDDDGFDLMQFTDDGDNGINVKGLVKIEKKGKGKAKPKAVPKKKVTKKKVARRPQAQSAEDGNDEGADEGEEVKKTGDKRKRRVLNYTLTRDVDGSKIYTCNTCQRVYRRQECVQRHNRHVHLKQPRLHTCTICQAKVPEHLRTLHREKVHGVPPPTCGACGKKFSLPCLVIQHQRIYHMGERKFTCFICSKKFSSQADLKRHQITHSSLRLFECDHCGKSFKRKKTLTVHIKIHTDDRKQVCAVCGQAFIQHNHLKNHVRRKHPEMV